MSLDGAGESLSVARVADPVAGGGSGSERMRALLARLGDPQRAFAAVHVVGTNGKIDAPTRRTLRATDRRPAPTPRRTCRAGTSGSAPTPRRTSSARSQRVRPHAEALGATQFEVLTAAAFADFAARGVDGGRVEAGLGGRLDATNVIDARVVVLTNVALEHTDVLGDTREAIAAEKLAVAAPGAAVVLAARTRSSQRLGAAVVEVARRGALDEAAEAFLGRPVDRWRTPCLPGRLERRATREIRDGAHTPDGGRLAARAAAAAARLRRRRLDPRRQGRRRDARARSRAPATTLVATQLDEPARAAGGGARRPARAAVRSGRDRRRSGGGARARARARGPRRVLVTGSLYLLADLSLPSRRTRMPYDVPRP